MSAAALTYTVEAFGSSFDPALYYNNQSLIIQETWPGTNINNGIGRTGLSDNKFIATEFKVAQKVNYLHDDFFQSSAFKNVSSTFISSGTWS